MSYYCSLLSTIRAAAAHTCRLAAGRMLFSWADRVPIEAFSSFSSCSSTKCSRDVLLSVPFTSASFSSVSSLKPAASRQVCHVSPINNHSLAALTHGAKYPEEPCGMQAAHPSDRSVRCSLMTAPFQNKGFTVRLRHRFTHCPCHYDGPACARRNSSTHAEVRTTGLIPRLCSMSTCPGMASARARQSIPPEAAPRMVPSLRWLPSVSTARSRIMKSLHAISSPLADCSTSS